MTQEFWAREFRRRIASADRTRAKRFTMPHSDSNASLVCCGTNASRFMQEWSIKPSATLPGTDRNMLRQFELLASTYHGR
jgi:hypothetical protein